MRSLVVTDELKSLKEYAEANPVIVTIHQVRLMNKKNEFGYNKVKPVGGNQNYVRHLPVGYRVVFSIEHQPKAKCRHLSVSVESREGKLPNVHAVALIMKELGFEQSLGGCHVWIEHEAKAINVLEVIK